MKRRHFLKSLLGGTAAIAAGVQSSSSTVRAVAPGAFTVNYMESYDGSIGKFFEDWVKLIYSDTADESKVRAVSHESVAGLPITKVKNSGVFGRHPEETLSQINLGYEVSFTMPDFLKQE